MHVAAFVQARMGSERLPGKSMLAIWRDMPLIELVLRRVQAAVSVARVVLLTTVRELDQPLVDVADRLGVSAFRGPEDDVLTRFTAALGAHPTDAVVRICADNPFIDPRAIDELVEFFHQAQPCDYASNHTVGSGLPDGTGAEIMTAEALLRAAASAIEPLDREHVTSYIACHPEQFRLAYMPASRPDRSPERLDVDDANGYLAMRSLAERLPDEDAPLWDREVILAALNTDSGAPR